MEKTPPQLRRAVNNLSRAIQFPTVSNHDITKMDLAQFSALEKFLEESYPLLHQNLEKTVINEHGLLFHWRPVNKGTDAAGNPLKPALLTAHYDVVPVKPEGWPHPPFSGAIADDKIYGRGSFDDKGSLIAVLETVESLLEEGFSPRRSLYFAFGFDEEVNGYNGASRIASYLSEQDVHFEFVLDEGGAVADGSMMGIKPPIAVVGMAEKGNSNFEFTFHGEQGHSSTPPPQTSIAKMAAFINAVAKRGRPVRLTDTLSQMLKTIAPQMPAPGKYFAAHPKAAFPVLKKALMKSRQTAAMLKTTITFTMTNAGTAPNALATTARCTANVRILQGETAAELVDWFKSIDPEVEIRTLAAEDPTPSASTTSAAFMHLRDTIKTIFSDAIVTPYLMVGGTDSRHYVSLADNCYRFLPTRVSEYELSLMHGTGEYLSIANLENMLAFYRLFISSLDRNGAKAGNHA